MNITVETITPDKAQEILDTQRKNRKLNRTWMAILARRMREGHFDQNGDTIVIDEEGHLIDGQHRLHAVIESETTQSMIIVRDVVAKAQHSIDTGKKRSASDVLSMEGFYWPALMASISKIVILYDKRELNGQIHIRGVSNSEVLTFARRNQEALLEAMHKWGSRGQRELWEPSTACAVYFILSRIDKLAADRIFDGLAHGTNLAEDDPVLLFRNKLMKQALIATKHWVRRNQWRFLNIATAFKVFNLVREGKTVNRLIVRNDIDTLPQLV